MKGQFYAIINAIRIVLVSMITSRKQNHMFGENMTKMNEESITHSLMNRSKLHESYACISRQPQ
jgi:hypothetical protein